MLNGPSSEGLKRTLWGLSDKKVVALVPRTVELQRKIVEKVYNQLKL